ncbi:prophage antirepressor-like protein [Lipingzhangella halophila]|uniref:Prophage antirepressor-like protein n=1 Tax=Lipingzhangella halophila TaxID=1783352 RepID=A0A7W7W3G5_9ACTN|nr:BRO family protein [Lipingzhangella halophila]MBB4931784.1 prophage antirepressor-like protein [Lipingzhangella halophila]
MTELQLFTNGEFDLRVAPDGDSFTVEAPELSRALGFRESYNMLRSVPDAEKGSSLVRTPGGGQQVWHVTEPGFYRILGQRQASRIKEAEIREQVVRFQDWVYREVLPAIRRTGSYSATGSATPATVSWEQAAAIARVQHGFDISAGDLRELLTRGGILTLTGRPHKRWEHLFWPLSSRWEIHERVLPQLIAFALKVRRELVAAEEDLQMSLPLSMAAAIREVPASTD